MMSLISCEWFRRCHNGIITGPTGAGKTFLACALAHKVCREGYRALYLRAPACACRMTLARRNGSYGKTMRKIARTHLLVIDDLFLASMTDAERRNLLEVIEDRHSRTSTIIASQLPIDHWHEQIGNPAIADATLDSVVHNAHKINLSVTGESMKKKYGAVT